MSRKLLYLAPIVLPFLLYGFYAWWAKRKAQQAGGGGADKDWNDARGPGWRAARFYCLLQLLSRRLC